MVHIEAHNWSKNRVSVECLATNGTCASHLLPRLRDHKERRVRKILRARGREGPEKTESSEHDRCTTLMNSQPEVAPPQEAANLLAWSGKDSCAPSLTEDHRQVRTSEGGRATFL